MLDDLDEEISWYMEPLGDPGFSAIDWASYRWIQSFHRSDYELSINLSRLT